MNCKRCQRLISDWLDGDLSIKDKEKVERHLRRCDSCRQHFDDLKFLEARIKSLSTVDYSDWAGFENRLTVGLNKIKAEQKDRRGFWVSIPAPAWAMSLMVLIMVVFMVFFLKPEGNNGLQLASLLSYEDSYLSLSQIISEDESLASRLNEEIVDSIVKEIKDDEVYVQNLKQIDINQQQIYEYDTENNLLNENFILPEEK